MTERREPYTVAAADQLAEFRELVCRLSDALNEMRAERDEARARSTELERTVLALTGDCGSLALEKERVERANERLRVLLREAAPKCQIDGCHELATHWYIGGWCDEHAARFCGPHPFDLGVRIRAALGEEEK